MAAQVAALVDEHRQQAIAGACAECYTNTVGERRGVLLNSSVAQQASSAACAARKGVEDRRKTNESKLQKEKKTQKKEKDKKGTRGGFVANLQQSAGQDPE